MRLRYIELFHAVMTTNSLTGAANLLNISQPAASKALQQAEHQLGFTLFHRVRGRLHPTEQALLLRPRVEKIIRDLHDLQRLTANFARPESEPLRVTCTPTLAQSLVPDATTLLRKAWLKLRLAQLDGEARRDGARRKARRNPGGLRVIPGGRAE